MKHNNSHLTAKERDKLSFPTNWLLKNQLIKGSVLDFGCGLGADVKGLSEKGFFVVGYDKYYSPDFPTEKFDTIICQYVLNVLEPEHQERLLMEIFSLLNKEGKAYVTVRRDVRFEGYRTHKLHNETTYQRDVRLCFPSVFLNEFCEIYVLERKPDIKNIADCIFCKPSPRLEYITESSNCMAVFDGYPVSKGHTLIVPKEHISNYFEIPKSLQCELWEMVTFINKILTKKFHPDGFNVGINCGEAAGQTVFHAHIHVIPRYAGDTPNPRGGVRHVIKGRGSY